MKNEPPTPRPELVNLIPAHHGARVPRELEDAGLDPNSVLDFSTNVNPFGPSPAIRETLANVDVAAYPDRHVDVLSEAVAVHCGVTRERVLVGNGASQLIWLIAMTYAYPGRRVVLLTPTFGEYAQACHAMGAEIIEVWAAERDDYAFQPEMVNAISEVQPDIVFVCNPNNPTGRLLTPDKLRLLRQSAPDALWVVDEAYRNFVKRPPSLESLLDSDDGVRLLLLRSMTKDYALAGLRLGYVLGREETLAPLRAVQPAWSVSTAAQAAGLAALQDIDHLVRTIADTRYVGAKLLADLEGIGMHVLPTDAHFALVHVGDGNTFRATLLMQGIQVRSAASFGLSSYIRIAPRKPADNSRLVEVIGGLTEGYG